MTWGYRGAMWTPIALALLSAVLPTLKPQDALEEAALAPDILFILTDDQRVDTIGAWGNHGIATPNIDRLVAQGTSFRRNYCMGSPHGAVCAPSRAMIHSGRAYHSIDHSGMTDVELLGESLQARGYRTLGVGKWHNGQASFKRSFHEGRAVLFGGMSNHFAVPLHDVAEDGTATKRETVEEHSSELFTEAALELLASADESSPLFLSVAFTAPHDPRDPPLAWRDRPLPELPSNFKPQHAFDNGHLTLRDEKLSAWPRDPEVVRRQLAEYYGLIEHMDVQIGRILDALQARDSGRETVIVFAADHGLAVGSHGLLGKQSVYEHSLRAPLVIVGPGVPAGQHVTALTYLLDIHPTLLAFAGPEPPPEDGPEGESSEPTWPDASDLGYVARDLAPIWSGERAGVRDSIFLSMGSTQRAVSDGRWKYCVYPKVGHRQLFDLASDPSELINLAERPAFAHHIARLQVTLEEWRERTGDRDLLVAPKLKPLFVDLTGRMREPDRWQPQWIRDTYFDPPSPADQDPAGDSPVK